MTPARRYVNLEFHQKAQSRLCARHPRRRVDPSEVRANYILERGKKQDGREKLAGKRDELTVLDHVEQNESSEIRDSSESDTPKLPPSTQQDTGPPIIPRKTKTAPTPLGLSNSSSSENNNDGYLSEDATPTESPTIGRFSWDEDLDQEVFLEGPMLTDEDNASLALSPGSTTDPSTAHSQDEREAESADRNIYCTLGLYHKENEFEVSLRENSSVEVLEESEGGWWLVRTGSHSVGWAPSNYLEKIESLRTYCREDACPSLLELPKQEQCDVPPARPPKSPRVRKMSKRVSIEQKFWKYYQSKKETEVESCLETIPKRFLVDDKQESSCVSVISESDTKTCAITQSDVFNLHNNGAQLTDGTSERLVPDKESGLGVRVENSCHLVQDNLKENSQQFGFSDACAFTEVKGCASAESECVNMAEEDNKINGPSLAVPEDLEDLED